MSWLYMRMHPCETNPPIVPGALVPRMAYSPPDSVMAAAPTGAMRGAAWNDARQRPVVAPDRCWHLIGGGGSCASLPRSYCRLKFPRAFWNQWTAVAFILQATSKKKNCGAQMLHEGPIVVQKAPHLIVVGNEKGGSGKTTIAMHVAVALLKEGQRVGTI